MTGTDVMNGLISAARKMHYLVFHDEDARGNEPGFPDLIIAGYGAAWAIECKSQKEPFRPSTVTKKGRTLPGQLDWLYALGQARVATYVCRPETGTKPKEPWYSEIGYDDMLSLLETTRTVALLRGAPEPDDSSIAALASTIASS